MKRLPTRASLLIRIRQTDDHDAWNEFAQIYRPAIIRLARMKGLQNADAEDLAQQVLVSISRAIQNWQPDPSKARFRTWLSKVTQNAVLNSITRQKPDQATGEDDPTRLNNLAESDQQATQLNVELRREAFRYAANEIKSEFHLSTWEAFWLTSVDNLSPEVAAKRLEKSVGAVYAARSRVMRRLKEKVQEISLFEESSGTHNERRHDEDEK